jgi:hypothetical protein
MDPENTRILVVLDAIDVQNNKVSRGNCEILGVAVRNADVNSWTKAKELIQESLGRLLFKLVQRNPPLNVITCTAT